MGARLAYYEEVAHSILSKWPGFLKPLTIVPINFVRCLRIQKLKTPIQVMFYITNRCNARCKHCFYWKNLNDANELTLQQIEKIAYSLKHPLDLLALTGGEPFLREDIAEICDIFYQINKTKRINIPTNGLLTRRILKAVRETLEKEHSKRLTIQFSIDSLEENHDDMRGVKRAFAKISSTIYELKPLKNEYANFDLCVSTTISKHNLKDIDKIKNYVQNKFNIFHKFSLVRTSRNVYRINPNILSDFSPPDESYVLPSIQELERLCLKMPSEDLEGKVEALKIRYSLDIIKREKRILNCLAGKADAAIFPSGEATFCEPTKPFGNLKETNFDLYRLWHTNAANQRREQIKNCSCIQTCNLYNAMKYDTKTLLRLFSENTRY